MGESHRLILGSVGASVLAAGKTRQVFGGGLFMHALALKLSLGVNVPHPHQISIHKVGVYGGMSQRPIMGDGRGFSAGC